MQRKKVAILGVTGMLGSALEKEFSCYKACCGCVSKGETVGIDFDLIKTTRAELDAQNCTVEAIVKIIEGAEYAVNCIGIIKPYIHDNDSAEVQRAIEVNGLFQHKLAAAANKTGTKVIQIATDCVFDGVKGNYTEDDKHNAIDVYGKTKSLGEVSADNFLNLRCSIIGREKKSYLSLLEWFLNQPKGAKLNGFKNHFWNGVTTNAFAKICRGIIENDGFKAGLQHIVAADSPSKAEMLHIFKEVFNRSDIIINDIDAEIAINRTLATNDDVKNAYLWRIAGYENIPTVKEMIEELA